MKREKNLTLYLLLSSLLSVSCLSVAADKLGSTPTAVPRGEYVLRHSAGIGFDSRKHTTTTTTDYDKFCKAFTANLNEFRYLDFETCNARLSPKYPQFSRPTWEEIPLDMEVAKKIVLSPPGYGGGFERWLKVTETARAKGEVKLWRIKVDLLKDGNLDTLLRLDHRSDGDRPYCSYYDSRQIITDIPDPEAAHWYAGYWNYYIDPHLGGDMIYDKVTNRYYMLEWNRYGRVVEGWANYGTAIAPTDIGATASVLVSSATDRGVHAVCWIDWVPTGKHKKQ